MLLLKGAREGNIEESWPMILHDTYLYSKHFPALFPLPRDLIESVDRILDKTVASLGTKYMGVWYLPNPDENISELLPGAKYFISDQRSILRLALTWRKPCVYFNRHVKRCVLMLKNNNHHETWAKGFGFTPAEIIYYEPKHKYRGHDQLIRSIYTPSTRFSQGSKKP